MSDSPTVRVAVDAGTELGEGPVWDAAAGVLRFVDITRGRAIRFDPTTGDVTSVSVGQPVSAVIPNQTGGLIAVVRDGVAELDERSGSLRMLWPVEADVTSNRMNDAKCDPRGRLWAGTMAFDFRRGAGSLYRLTEGTCIRVLEGVTISNGLSWSPEGDRMYYIDSGEYAVDVFDFDLDEGLPRNRRRLVEFDPEQGMPDGMTVDGEGYLWVALWGGSRIERYTPTGKLERSIPLPVSQVTSVAFGGPALSDLFITTAAFELDEPSRSAQPLAGATFVASPGVSGLPAFTFSG